MKTFAHWMTQLGFMWIGFWLPIVDKGMAQQLYDAADDEYSKYPVKDLT